MSYSFQVKAASKAEALEKVKDEFATVLERHPTHNIDQSQSSAAVTSFVNLLQDDDTRDVSVRVSGSLWTAKEGVQQVSLQVEAQLATRS